MATNFPGSLDSFTNPVAGDSLASPSHAGQHADVNDAIEAIETKLGIGAGTIGTWTSYTPVFTNFTLGDGTLSAHYCEINDVVLVTGNVTLGSTSSVTGELQMTTPTGGVQNLGSYNGVVRFGDATGGTTLGTVILAGASAVRLRPSTAGGTYVAVGVTSATTPFTWATSDNFYWSYWYRKA